MEHREEALNTVPEGTPEAVRPGKRELQARTEGFRWLPSYYNILRGMPDRDRLLLCDAINDCGFGNEPGELPPRLKGIFGLIRPSVEKSVRFEQRQRENGRKGGRPKKVKEPPEDPGPES